MALPVTETFTGTNGTDLDVHNAGWLQIDATNKAEIQTDRAASNAAGYAGARWTGDVFAADHEISGVYYAGAGPTLLGALLVRSTGTGGSQNAYESWVYETTLNLYLYRAAGGLAPTNAIAGPLGVISNTDVIRCWVVGTAIHLSVNGSEVSGSPFTDATYDGTSSAPGLVVVGTGPTWDSVTMDGAGGGGGGKVPVNMGEYRRRR